MLVVFAGILYNGTLLIIKSFQSKTQKRGFMLKFTGVAKVGDIIRAYDFKPCAGRDDAFIEGDVIDLGAKVTVLQGDAEVPAPDGSHTLEDGDVITTKDGVITAFDDKGDQEEGETPEAPDVDTDKDTANSGGQDEMVKMLKEFITNMSKKINEMESNYAELQNQFKTFSKLPATKKIVDGKTDFNRATESETDSRLNAILALKNKINN